MLGNGLKMNFWNDGWLQGCTPRDIAPNLFKFTTRKKLTVNMVLTNNSWIADIPIHRGITTVHLAEFAYLWSRIRNVQLSPLEEDRITWKFTPSGQYSAASAYKAQFIGCTRAERPNYLWKSWAPPKCKFFMWLVTLRGSNGPWP